MSFRDKLSVKDAILAMQVCEWTKEEIILRAELGNLEFDVAEFLKEVEKNAQIWK